MGQESNSAHEVYMTHPGEINMGWQIKVPKWYMTTPVKVAEIRAATDKSQLQLIKVGGGHNYIHRSDNHGAGK